MVINHKPDVTLGKMIIAEYEHVEKAGLIIRYDQVSCRVFHEDCIEFEKDYIAVELYSLGGVAPYPRKVIPLHSIIDIQILADDRMMENDP